MTVNSPHLYFELHEGRGPYLLLVHGMLSSRAQWRLNLEALSSCCRPVVTELWGHGRSPAPSEPELYRPDGYVREFERIRRELGVSRWLVCGQSLGAALTLRYALDEPERVIAQVFTNSTSAAADPAWGPAMREGLGAWSRQLDARGRAALDASPVHPRRAKSLPAAVRDELVADCARHDLRGIGLTGTETVPHSTVRERLRENRVPTLLVVGQREERFQPHLEFARQNMPHLEVRAAEAGHAVNAEAAPQFNDWTTAFFSRHASPLA